MKLMKNPGVNQLLKGNNKMPTRVELTQPSYLMSLILPQMNQLRSAYEGGMIFKQEVLIKKPRENKALFEDKIKNVATMPICKSIIDEMIDIMFEQEPARELLVTNSVNQVVPTPQWLLDFVIDADLSLNTLSDVMEKAATLASVEGWSWIFADLPSVAMPTNRPYLSVTAAQNVIDYEYDDEALTPTLSYLRVIEYQDQEKSIIKVWEAGGTKEIDGVTYTFPTTASRYEVEVSSTTQNDTAIEPFEVFEFGPDYRIPAFQLIPNPDLRNQYIGDSDITDAAEVQREILFLEAEAFDSIRFSKPLVRASASAGKIGAASGSIVRAEVGEIEVIAIPTADISEIRNTQMQLIQSLDGYLGRSSSRKITNATQSGISIVEERRGLHRKAASRARVIQSTEEEILSFVCWMMGFNYVGEVNYNTDYEAKDTQFRLALLKTAKELSINPIIQDIIDVEVLTMISPSDDLAINLKKLENNKVAINKVTQNVELVDDTSEDSNSGVNP